MASSRSNALGLPMPLAAVRRAASLAALLATRSICVGASSKRSIRPSNWLSMPPILAICSSARPSCWPISESWCSTWCRLSSLELSCSATSSFKAISAMRALRLETSEDGIAASRPVPPAVYVYMSAVMRWPFLRAASTTSMTLSIFDQFDCPAAFR